MLNAAPEPGLIAARQQAVVAALLAVLPARCVLDSQTTKALFSGFRDPVARDGVLEQFARYGAALKAVEAEDTRTAAPARN